MALLSLVVMLGLSACIILPDFGGQAKAGKYQPTQIQTLPSATAKAPTPRMQTEPHTCGLHAMESLYTAYGLDPTARLLRFRLGTDKPAVRIDKTTTGTLHPDLYRVLVQDGFAVTPLDLNDSAASGRLAAHLTAGQLAVTVVYRGTYHWMVLAPSTNVGKLVVIDSLVVEPSEVDVEAFIDDALSITLVEPGGGMSEISASEAHRTGLVEMTSTYGRVGDTNNAE